MDCALIFIERECGGDSSGAPSLERECDVALNGYRIKTHVSQETCVNR